MDRTVFLNGSFLPEGEAKLSIFDRGLLFADSVYEGFGILDSQLVDYEYHMDRLDSRLASWKCHGRCPVTNSLTR